MKTFKASKWDSDAEEHHSYQEMFKGSSVKKRKDRSKFVAGDGQNSRRKLKKMLQKQLRDLNNDVNVITVQTKIALGKAQKNRDISGARNSETSQNEKLLRKKCKKSKPEMSSDSSEDSDNEVRKKQKKMLKKYSSELNTLNSNSDKLSEELLREKKRQKKLKKKLEKAVRKQVMLSRAIETKIKDKIEDLQMRKIKKEPIDEPIKHLLYPTDQKMGKKKEKEKTSSETNIPNSLQVARRIKLQEKLKTILNQVEKKETKPVLTLRQKMMEKLKAARFRFLNEQIYTTDSKEAQRIFRSDPEAFIAYHEGYRQQVKSWPVNPLDVIIKAIRKMPKNYIVADFGCGDAKLAKCVEQKVYSFDLVAIDDSVIACDMAKVPLKDASVDVAVFCLSLMGTNLHDYILEANRVLKVGGILKIAEVESRFDNVDTFIEGVQRFGFKKTWKDLSKNLFYYMDFKKALFIKNKKKLPTISLLPCLYKKR